MKHMMQFRFYGKDSEKNYPLTASFDDWRFNLFSKYSNNISHLGIQGEPGLIFYLNGGQSAITIGDTGIYELDLEGIGRISSLRFDGEQLTALYPTPATSSTHRILVDIVYDGMEG